ncbi:MAG TPA: nucleolar RNA-binding Nop10p family protein [Thermoplasmataceae archaeon]|nr:nucleolar RNA-binding Nop10p family protein [Thermoplasmataceae archaeon]
MKEICPNCMRDTVVALPPKFSPSDKFQRFRLKEGSEKWRR